MALQETNIGIYGRGSTTSVHQWLKGEEEERITTEPDMYPASGKIQRHDRNALKRAKVMCEGDWSPLRFHWAHSSLNSQWRSIFLATCTRPWMTSLCLSTPPRGKNPSHCCSRENFTQVTHVTPLKSSLAMLLLGLWFLRANKGLKSRRRGEMWHELEKWTHLCEWLGITVTSCEICGDSLNFSKYNN